MLTFNLDDTIILYRLFISFMPMTSSNHWKFKIGNDVTKSVIWVRLQKNVFFNEIHSPRQSFWGIDHTIRFRNKKYIYKDVFRKRIDNAAWLSVFVGLRLVSISFLFVDHFNHFLFLWRHNHRWRHIGRRIKSKWFGILWIFPKHVDI